ncbi:MAG: TMEM175 family protein [Gammaproteobacteria bacterium]
MGSQQLIRLGRLTDGVFAVSIVVLVAALPQPTESEWQGDTPLGFLGHHANDLSFVLIAMLLVGIYWHQSNGLLGSLRGTDGRHASLVLAQVCLLVLYLYIVSLAVDFPDSAEVLALQSIGAAVVGLLSMLGWRYASKNRRLLADDITQENVAKMNKAGLAEPLTALVTLPFAWLGPDIWGLSWLSYLLVQRLLK